MPDGEKPAEPAPLTHIFPDRPAVQGEIRFQFTQFPRTLAELALNPANGTPFTVVVRGEWGRGKTTLLQEARRILKDEGTGAGGRRIVKTLWFNAWKYPQEDTILAGLLGALLDEIRQGGLLDQLMALLEKHKEWLAWKVLRVAFPWVFEKEPPDGRFAEVREQRAFYDHFEELFRELSYVWLHRGEAGRHHLGTELDGATETVAVFLDDLDRCAQDRVLEVLEAIKLFLDMPGVCFFMGLDWNRLLEVIGTRYAGRREEFLEKVVQIALDLPPITQEGIEGYIGRLVEGTPLAEMLPPEMVRLIALRMDARRRNPRHAKRFLNDLSLRLGVLGNMGKLGDGQGRLPAEAVTAWHVLAEAMQPERWHVVSRERGDLDVFLDGYRSILQPAENGPEGAAEGDVSFFEVEEHRKLLDILLKLDPRQRHDLIHLGSPLREAAATAVARSGKPRPVGPEPEWITIPAGPFEMGSTRGGDERLRTIALSEYRISRYPVTNTQYAAYVTATGRDPPQHWEDGDPPKGREEHPVVNVSWQDAAAYCAWLANEKELPVRLPTEAQWEKAARGTDGREYPWGNEEPTEDHANLDNKLGDTTPVNRYPQGVSPYGVMDMAGNVWEWCRDWYGDYSKNDLTNPQGAERGRFRVLRGGAWYDGPGNLRATFRCYDEPEGGDGGVGFRCVVDAAGGQ